jgi:hypothetical protein
MSLANGAVNAKDQYQYRSSHDARIPFGVLTEKHILLPGETFTFGKRNRPQTPVNAILANYFGEQAGSQMQQRYVDQKSMVFYNYPIMCLCFSKRPQPQALTRFA